MGPKDLFARMKTSEHPEVKSFWVRFVLVTFFLVLDLFFLPLLNLEALLIPLLYTCLLSYAANFVSLIWIVSDWNTRYRVYFATFIDISLITVAVYYLGGIMGHFSWIYALTIMAIALLHGIRVSLYVTVLSCLMNTGLFYVETTGILSPVEIEIITRIPFEGNELYFYSRLMSDNVLFIATGLITGFLSEQWISSKRDLEGEVEDRTKELSTANEKLDESRERYRTTLDAMPDMVYETTFDGKILYANQAAFETLGYPLNGSRRVSLMDLLDKEGLETVFRVTEELLDGKEPQPAYYNVRAADGRIVPVESRVTLLKRDSREPTFLGVVRDITERKRVEDELQRYREHLEEEVKKRTRELIETNGQLREKEEKYRSLFEESKDVVFISAPDGKFLDINPAGVEVFGYSSKEEVLLLDVAKDIYVNEDDRETLKGILEEQGFVKDYELVLKSKDGRELNVLVTATAVRDEAGVNVAHRGIMRDITERKQLERQLFQAQKMESIGTLAGGIAHDFNNILSGILGYASLLKSETSKNDPHFSFLDTIEKSATRASELTAKLLAFARGGKYKAKAVDLNRVANETLDIIGRTFDKAIEIETHFHNSLPTVEADATQMEQVLMNFCVNARDAMPEGGKLIIETDVALLTEEYVRKHMGAKPGSYVVLSVTDSGIGMDKETMEKVFEPFFTTKEEGKSTGLGLAMVYGVVKNHGGHVRVYSEPGYGSTFKVYLPVYGKPEEQDTPQYEPLLGGSEVILVVDDEELILSLTSDLLKSHGYKVLLAKDGEEAIEVYQEHDGGIDLVILDMVMPNMGGRETFLKLKDLNSGVKAILSTGYSQNGRAREILASGVKGFIQKPYNVFKLLTEVRKVLDVS